MRKWIPGAFVLVLASLTAAACDETTGIEVDEQLARTLNSSFEQTDRFGLPAIATVFIPTAKKDAYNAASPSGDVATYTADVVAVLKAFGNDDATANALAAALLPDAQPINTSQVTGFLNGRRLQDDVITAELGLIFGANAALNDDNVDGNDLPFSPTFPYLASPHGS
jgi:hypothetical protein